MPVPAFLSVSPSPDPALTQPAPSSDEGPGCDLPQLEAWKQLFDAQWSVCMRRLVALSGCIGEQGLLGELSDWLRLCPMALTATQPQPQPAKQEEAAPAPRPQDNAAQKPKPGPRGGEWSMRMPMAEWSVHTPCPPAGGPERGERSQSHSQRERHGPAPLEVPDFRYVTITGEILSFDTTADVLRPFGVLHGQRLVATRGEMATRMCTVIGAASLSALPKPCLWVHFDHDRGAMILLGFVNGQEIEDELGWAPTGERVYVPEVRDDMQPRGFRYPLADGVSAMFDVSVSACHPFGFYHAQIVRFRAECAGMVAVVIGVLEGRLWVHALAPADSGGAAQLGNPDGEDISRQYDPVVLGKVNMTTLVSGFQALQGFGCGQAASQHSTAPAHSPREDPVLGEQRKSVVSEGTADGSVGGDEMDAEEPQHTMEASVSCRAPGRRKRRQRPTSKKGLGSSRRQNSSSPRERPSADPSPPKPADAASRRGEQRVQQGSAAEVAQAPQQPRPPATPSPEQRHTVIPSRASTPGPPAVVATTNPLVQDALREPLAAHLLNLANAGVALARADRAGGLTLYYASPHLCALCAKRRSEWVGQGLEQLANPAHTKPEALQRLAEAAGGGVGGATERVVSSRGEGGLFDAVLRVEPLRGDDNDVVVLLLIDVVAATVAAMGPAAEAGVEPTADDLDGVASIICGLPQGAVLIAAPEAPVPPAAQAAGEGWAWASAPIRAASQGYLRIYDPSLGTAAGRVIGQPASLLEGRRTEPAEREALHRSAAALGHHRAALTLHRRGGGEFVGVCSLFPLRGTAGTGSAAPELLVVVADVSSLVPHRAHRTQALA